MVPPESLANARDRSSVRAWVERVVSGSSFLDWVLMWRSRARRASAWMRSSVAVETVAKVSAIISGVAARSKTADVSRAIGEVARSSFVYRWLTAEPDPEVIVVDLEETLAVGPPLRAIDGLLATVHSQLPGSRLVEAGQRSAAYVEETPVRALSVVALSALVTHLAVSVATGAATLSGSQVELGLAFLAVLGLRSETSLDELRESWMVRLLVALLAPPEPPRQTSEAPEERKSMDGPALRDSSERDASERDQSGRGSEPDRSESST